MRISNWTQFAKIFGDPNEPDNGPFMEGAYLAHSVYGFFQNGGSLCWIVRVGDDGGDGARARAPRCPPRPTRRVEAFRAVALEGVDGEVKVELTEEPVGGRRTRDADLQARRQRRRRARRSTTGLTLKKGRTNLATKVNAASKLIKIEETGASLPEAQRVPATGTYTLSAPAIEPDEGQADRTSRATSPRRQGMGGLAAVDEITMVVHAGHHDARRRTATTSQLRDLQGKMIAHCENAGDRMAILDAPPDLLPQEILEWRMNTAGYDSKFAALYYPWIEVMDPLTNQPMMVPPSGHVAGVWCRTDVDARRAQGARPTRSSWAPTASASRSRRPSRAGSTRSASTASASFPGRGIRDLGRPHAVERPGVALHQRPPALQLRRRVDHGGHAVERVRAQRREAVDPAADRGVELPHPRVARRARCSAPRPAQAFYVKCDAETNPPEVIEAGQVICEIGIAPVKPAEFVDLPAEPVQRRRRLRGQRVVASTSSRKERPACRPMTRKHTSRSGSP